jgi:hypothetical protein
MKLRTPKFASFAGILTLSLTEVYRAGLEMSSLRPTTQNGVSNGEATQLKRKVDYFN